MAKVAVVILNWNTKDLLRRFLPTVLEHTAMYSGAEVIVADNASTDGSVDVLCKEFPNVRCIVLAENYGFAGGYNKALAQVEADYYVLLNSDVETTPGWIAPLVQHFEQNDSIAVAVPKIRSQCRKEYFEHAGAAGGYIDKYGFPFCAGRVFDTVEVDFGQYDRSCSIFWGSGAALMIKSELWHRMGGLDVDFFAHMEEIDLCWRLKNMGYSIQYCSESTVFHVGGGTLPEASPFKLYLNFRNNLFLLYKNLPAKGFVSTLFVRFLLDGVAALKFLAGGELPSFYSVLKAHVHFYKSWRSVAKKRKQLLVGRTVCCVHPEVHQKSVVGEYFLRGKRKFSQFAVRDNQ